jgi:hypothetical protein
MTVFLVFINSFTKNCFQQKVLLKTDSAALSGEQVKLTFMYFSFPLLEAALSTSTLCFLFTRTRKLLFLIIRAPDAIFSYLYVPRSYYYLFTRC